MRRLICTLTTVILMLMVGVWAIAQAPVGAITAISFSPDGKFLAVGSVGQVAVFDVSNWMISTSYDKIEDTVRSLAWRPDGQVLAIGHGKIGVNGKVSLWTVNGSAPVTLLAEHSDNIEAIEYKSDGNSMLIASDDNKACFVPSITGKERNILDEHNGRVIAASFSPGKDGLFITGSLDKMVKVWEESTKKVIVNFDQPEAGLTGLAWLSNGTQMVGSCLDGRLYWWGVYRNQKTKAWGGYFIRRVDAHDGGVNGMGASGNRARLITAGENKTVSVWDMNNGNRMKTFHDANHPVYAVALNTDGKMGAGGGRDGAIWVWDVDAEKLITTLAMPPLPAAVVPPQPALKKPIAIKTKRKSRSSL